MVRIHLSTLLGERKMTQKDLATKTGIRAATINQYYHEFVDRINVEHIDKICEVLNCSISDLLEYIPNKVKTTGKYLIKDSQINKKSGSSARKENSN